MLNRPKIGICVTDLSISQCNFYAILEATKRHQNGDFIFFYENLERPCLELLCGAMQFSEVFNFDGPTVATNLQTAFKLINCPGPHPKYFYCQDLEWTRLQYKEYHTLANIYRNNRLSLIARCNEHKDIIEDCWNTKVTHVCPSWKEVLDEIYQKTAKEIQFLVYGSRQNLPRRTLF